MRLSRVVISGFKTFAKRSEVVLDERITAIVGPNGSGKSNFVDAIRWGLGETSARELRGARMDEVIYAGGAGRGRMGLAEVELVLDNTDGRLTREDAEVSVSRRVARDGNSEFRLNGGRVRLRDIDRVLGPTGLTQSGYAVVAQHDIDGIIQATPPQRRSLVEQAAGVRAFKAACDDALERARRTEVALRRLEDFLAEAEPRCAELEAQCEQALIQRELASRLAELRGSLAREEWRAARARLKQARRRLEAATARAAAATEAAAGFGAGLDVQRERVAQCREAQRTARARGEAARLAAERAAGDARRWADRRSQGALQRSLAGAQMAAALEEVERARLLVVELEYVAPEPDAGGDGATQQLDKERERHRAAAVQLEQAEAQRSAGETALGSASAVRAAAVAALREALGRVRGIDESLAALDGEEADVRQRIETALAGGSDPRAEVAKAVLAGRIAGRRLRACFEVVDPADAFAIEAALERELDGWLVADLDSAVALLSSEGAREQVISAAAPKPATPSTPPPGARLALSAIAITHEDARGALTRLLGSTWLVADMAAARQAVARGPGSAALPDGTLVTAAAIRGGGRPGGAGAARALPHRQRLEAIAAQRAARSQARISAVASVAAAEQERARAEGLFDDARTASEEARRLVTVCRRDVDEAASARREAEHAASRIRLAAEDRQRRRAAADQTVQASAARAAAAELRLLGVESEVLIAVVRGQGVRLALQRAQQEVRAAAALVAAAAPPLAEAERVFAALDAERAEVAIAQARAADECAAAGREVATAEAAVTSLAEAVRDDDDEGPEPEAQDAEKAEREILRVERRIAALGPVNALAPEQLAELSLRTAGARNDRDDLGGACADIRSLCSHLAIASDRRFDEVFGAVSHHFQELFGELFPAGKAALRLENPPAREPADECAGEVVEEPAAAGVEIMAQPPGKRLQPLSLLSGGERALTALAVILALQQVNPSPFYVFDEVDAALDDSNVIRFTRMLGRLAACQQFIVVTHNHITMAAADALYGVTIDREGTSSILSVRLAARDDSPQGRIVAVREPSMGAAV